MRSRFTKLSIWQCTPEATPLLSTCGHPEEDSEVYARHKLCRCPLRFETDVAEEAYWMWCQQGHSIAAWQWGLVLLTVWSACLIWVPGITAVFGLAIIVGMGVLACIALGGLVLPHCYSTPQWVLQLGLLAAGCNCTALALCTNVLSSSNGMGVCGRLDLLAFSCLMFTRVFPWRWAASLSAGCALLPFLALCLRMHAIDTGTEAGGRTAVETAFGLWPIAVGWFACVALAYDMELRDRRLYVVQKALELRCVAKAPPPPAHALPRDNSMQWAPDTPQNLGEGTPLSGGSRASTRSSDFPPSFSPAAPHKPTEFLPQNLLSDASVASTRSESACRQPLETRTGTLLLCKLGATHEAPPLPTIPSALQQQAEALLAEVVAAAAAYRGDIFFVEADTVGVSWNCFRIHHNHQLDATFCALRVQRQVKSRLDRPCRMVLVSAGFIAGCLGSAQRRSPVVHGKYVQVARRLLHLSVPLKSKYSAPCPCRHLPPCVTWCASGE